MYILLSLNISSSRILINVAETNNIALSTDTITKDIITIDLASLLLLGWTIANSYLKVDITENIAQIYTYKVNIPKSSGEYILVRIGLKAIGITWATVVPVIKVAIFRARVILIS